MEDAAITQLDLGDKNALFAVFDGHGGCEVSKLVQEIFVNELMSNENYKTKRYKEALEEIFRKIDKFIDTP